MSVSTSVRPVIADAVGQCDCGTPWQIGDMVRFCDGRYVRDDCCGYAWAGSIDHPGSGYDYDHRE